MFLDSVSEMSGLIISTPRMALASLFSSQWSSVMDGRTQRKVSNAR